MCYEFMYFGSKNCNRNRRCRKCLHYLSYGCRFASWHTLWQLYFLRLFTFFQFYFLSYFLSFFILSLFFAMTVLKAIVSLYRAGEKKPIEGRKTMIKVMEENTLFSSFQKNIIEFIGLNERAQKFCLRSFDLKFYRLWKSMAKQRITPFQHSSNWSWNCLSCLAQMGEAS